MLFASADLTVSLLTTPLAGPEDTIRSRRPTRTVRPLRMYEYLLVRVFNTAQSQSSTPMSDSIQIVDSTPQPPVFQVALLAHDCAKKDRPAQPKRLIRVARLSLLVYVRVHACRYYVGTDIITTALLSTEFTASNALGAIHTRTWAIGRRRRDETIPRGSPLLMCYCTALHMHQMAAMQRGARFSSRGPRGYDETIESCLPHACRQTRHVSCYEHLSPSSRYSPCTIQGKQAGRQALRVSGTTRKADADTHTLKHETLQFIKDETRRDPLMRTGLLGHVFNLHDTSYEDHLQGVNN
ncbi:hypothetical protein GGI42DRAFT_106849 [Trichoderma sp. SZMC 28013]